MRKRMRRDESRGGGFLPVSVGDGLEHLILMSTGSDAIGNSHPNDTGFAFTRRQIERFRFHRCRHRLPPMPDERECDGLRELGAVADSDVILRRLPGRDRLAPDVACEREGIALHDADVFEENLAARAAIGGMDRQPQFFDILEKRGVGLVKVEGRPGERNRVPAGTSDRHRALDHARFLRFIGCANEGR